MALPHGVMNKIRSKVRDVIGKDVHLDEGFFTYDRDTKQIVNNKKIEGWHFIFDTEGNLIKPPHKD